MIRFQGRCDLLGQFTILVDTIDIEDIEEEGADGYLADAIGFENGPPPPEMDFDGEPTDE